MPARLTAYLPEGAAAEFLLAEGARARIGRSPECELCLGDPSVSRMHASLEPVPGGWRLRDLSSKNGSFVDGGPPSDNPLPSSTWLRFGDIHCEFTIIDQDALARGAQWRDGRQRASAIHLKRLGQSRDLPDLLQGTLAAVVDLAGCERGFLLVIGPKGPAVRAWQGLDAGVLATPAFAGSVGAVDQALRDRRPLVLNDAGLDVRLGRRASVVSGGIRALACLPLAMGDEVLGLAYADSRQPGRAITGIELELLAAFADRAALWLAARRSELLLADAGIEAWPRVGAGAPNGVAT